MELIHVSGNTDCLLGKTAVGIYRIDDTRCILFDNGYSKEYDELVGSLKDAGLTPAGLIVSHAHIDHSGNLPNLVKQGFQGNIYSTFATRDLCQLMLADAARIWTWKFKSCSRCFRAALVSISWCRAPRAARRRCCSPTWTAR